MSVRRRTLLAGGGGSFRFPSVFSLGQTGFWQPISDRRAWQHNGKTYITWIEDPSGDEGVAAYTHATRTMGSKFTLHAALEADLHASGSVIVADNGKILCHYVEHHGDRIRRRVSTNPEDVSAFGSEALIGALSDTTYATNFQLNGVTDSPIYLFYRVTDGTHSYLVYKTTTDYGVSYTPATPTTIWEIAGKHVYWRIGSNHNARIDVTATDTDRSVGDPSSLYHFYLDAAAGTWHKSDGTTVTLPLDTTEATLIKSAADGPIQPEGISYDASGNPVAIMSVYDSVGVTNAVVQARWTGSAWSLVEIADTNGIVATNRFIGSACVNHENPDVVFLPRNVSGRSEMFRYVSPDDGASWVGTQLTVGSAADHAMPEVPDHATSGLQAIWGYGTYVADDNFAMTIYGYGA